jgi:ankyrin repeat protein
MTTPIDILLYDAARENDLTQIDFILETYSDTILADSPNVAYWIASKHGNKSIVEYLIKHVTDFNWRDNEYDETPLIIAVKNKLRPAALLFCINKNLASTATIIDNLTKELNKIDITAFMKSISKKEEEEEQQSILEEEAQQSILEEEKTIDNKIELDIPKTIIKKCNKKLQIK